MKNERGRRISLNPDGKSIEFKSEQEGKFTYSAYANLAHCQAKDKEEVCMTT